jgi:hypothetical protein
MGLGKKAKGAKVFTRKPYDKQLYKWSPHDDVRKKKKKTAAGIPDCTATAGSQGEDWNVTYVYQRTILKGIEHRYAYVECDYVK